MQSESARMTTAAEARFRIDHPNSTPRVVKVVALDEASKALVDELARLRWNRAAFFAAPPSASAAGPSTTQDSSLEAWFGDIAGQARDLVAEIDGADLVVMVASAGEEAQAASVIGEACSARGVTTIGLIVQNPAASEADMSRTLRRLRPHALMLVVASGRDYVEEMLAALRA